MEKLVEPEVAIIIAAYNEANILPEKIENTLALASGKQIKNTHCNGWLYRQQRTCYPATHVHTPSSYTGTQRKTGSGAAHYAFCTFAHYYINRCKLHAE